MTYAADVRAEQASRIVLAEALRQAVGRYPAAHHAHAA